MGGSPQPFRDPGSGGGRGCPARFQRGGGEDGRVAAVAGAAGFLASIQVFRRREWSSPRPSPGSRGPGRGAPPRRVPIPGRRWRSSRRAPRLGGHADHRLPCHRVLRGLLADVDDLGVPVRVREELRHGLVLRLHPPFWLVHPPPDHRRRCLVPLGREFSDRFTRDFDVHRRREVIGNPASLLSSSSRTSRAAGRPGALSSAFLRPPPGCRTRRGPSCSCCSCGSLPRSANPLRTFSIAAPFSCATNLIPPYLSSSASPPAISGGPARPGASTPSPTCPRSRPLAVLAPTPAWPASSRSKRSRSTTITRKLECLNLSAKSSVRSYQGRSPDHQLNGGSNRR